MESLTRWLERKFTIRKTNDPDEVNVNCPFCGSIGKSPDTGFHLGVSLRKNRLVCNCFRCGYRGSAVRLVADVERVSFAEAKGLVHFNRHTQISVAKPVHAIFSGYSYLKLPERSTEDPATVKLPSGYVPVNRDSVAQRRAWMYLDERGVTDELAKAFEVGFCLRGEYAFRLILPIRFHGEVVGFTARTVVDAKPKFRFPPGFPASEYLYNYDNAAASKLVIIVEGAFDSWRMPLSAVGLFSKNMSQKQKELIASTWRHAVVMLDRDAGREAVDVAAQLRPHLETVRVALLHDKDPWEAAPMELARAIKNSTSTGLEVLCSNIGN